VGQIAKLKGCRVVGIAEGPEKCRWFTESLGFDAAIDYRNDDLNDDLNEALDQHCPRGVDVLFENKGGHIMDAVFSRLNLNGRMVLRGLISSYNDERPLSGPTDHGRILMKRLTVKGFIIDYIPRFQEALNELQQWVANGDL